MLTYHSSVPVSEDPEPGVRGIDITMCLGILGWGAREHTSAPISTSCVSRSVWCAVECTLSAHKGLPILREHVDGDEGLEEGTGRLLLCAHPGCCPLRRAGQPGGPCTKSFGLLVSPGLTPQGAAFLWLTCQGTEIALFLQLSYLLCSWGPCLPKGGDGMGCGPQASSSSRKSTSQRFFLCKSSWQDLLLRMMRKSADN